jgi:hypothetical protein
VSGFGSGMRKSELVDGLCRNCCIEPAESEVDVEGSKDCSGDECGEAEKASVGGRQWTVSHGASDGKDLAKLLLGFGVIGAGCFFATGCLRAKNGCTCVGLDGDRTGGERPILVNASSGFITCTSSIGGNANGPGVAGPTGELSPSMTMISVKRDERAILP